MVLSKDVDTFYNGYGWIDGFVTGIHWDNNNMFDLLIDISSYEGRDDDGKVKYRDLTIRFKNCREAMFTVPKVFDRVSKEELEQHKANFEYSWYVITDYDAMENNGMIEANLKTIDDDPRWLNVKCEEIWVEGEGTP